MALITQLLSALPVPPDPSTDDNDTFPSKASAFTEALVILRNELSALITQINTQAVDLNAGVSTAMRYTFSTTTTDSDPGPGVVRLNNVTQNLATTIRLDSLDASGSSMQGLIDTFDDSSSTHKGFLRLQHATDPTKWILFSVASLASPAGYRNVTGTVAVSSAASPFANGDALIVSFARTGDVATGVVTEADVQNQADTAFTTAGTLTAYTVTASPAWGAYTANKTLFLTFHAASGANPTLNVSGLGATVQLVKQNADGSFSNIAAGDIPANHRSRVTLLSATQALVERLPALRLPRYMYGLTISNNVADAINDIDIAAGEATDSTRTVLMNLTAGVTRQLDAAFGVGNGGRFDAAIANGTWHIFLISNGVTVNVGMSQSLNPTGTPNYPAGYTYFWRIASTLREASSGLIGFKQDGDFFQRTTPRLDIDVTTPGAGAVTRTLQGVPTGINVIAEVTLLLSTAGAQGFHVLSDLATAPIVPGTGTASSIGAGPSSIVASTARVRTDTNAQVRSLHSSANADVLRVNTIGWYDTRGRFA